MASLVNELVGEYLVSELLGSGGMGEVYKATHQHLGRLIAIKVLLPGQTDGNTVRRFYGEASIQASLRHPGIAEYLGFYEFQGRPCILMEYVNGETLSAILARRGPFAPKEAVVILRAVVDVVAHFHGLGVVHRDIKSSNIKINSEGDVKVLDFGIARFQSTTYTTAGMVIGTPAVLAPEQVRGQIATKATDVWQLGVLAYEMLTGRMPFEASSVTELWALILNADFTPVARLHPGVPPRLEKIVHRCLQKDPTKRFASGKELQAALDEVEGKPSSLPAESPSAKVHAPYRLIAACVLVVILGVVVGVAGFHSNAGSSPGAAPQASLAASTDLRTVVVDTSNGSAEVFREGQLVGNTPYELHTKDGEKVDLLLRRDGYKDIPVQFEVTERKMYTYTMEPVGGR